MKKIALIISALFFTCIFAVSAYAGTWLKEGGSWKYKNDDGSFSKSCWQWIDGNGDGTAECYYFDGQGILYVSATTPDGYTVNSDGAWVDGGKVMTKAVGTPVSVDISKYSAETQANITEFLNSRNFSSMDDYSKAKTVFERIAAGHSGNVYDASTTGITKYATHLQILDYGRGVCHDFAVDYVTLARMVGLQADTYQPTFTHEEVLVKLNGQWYTLDPSTGNNFEAELTPANYEEKIHMAEDNFWNSDEGQRALKRNEYSAMWHRGEITSEECDALINALYGH